MITLGKEYAVDKLVPMTNQHCLKADSVKVAWAYDIKWDDELKMLTKYM